MRCQANSKHASLKVKCNTYKELSSTIFFFLLKESSWFCTEKDCRCFLFYTLSLPLSSALDFVHDVGFVTCMLLQGVSGFSPFHIIFFVLSTAQVRLSGCQKCNCARLFSFFFFFLPAFLKRSKMRESVSQLLFKL